MGTIYILSGTNRPGSRTRQIANHVLATIKPHYSHTEIIDLLDLPLHELTGANYGSTLPPKIREAIDKIDQAEGLVIVTPEYNGSMPGALKYFIDFWSYPKSFEYRPVAFVGLGFRWGGLRPVEHLQQVFNYRNAFIYPERVFVTDIGNALKDGLLVDTNAKALIEKQMSGFVKFIGGLKSQGLHANQRA